MNKNSPVPRIALLALIATLPLAAQAHRTWLMPSSTVASGKEPVVTVEAAVSEDLFEFDTNALKPDTISVVGPDGGAVATENPTASRRHSSFDIKLLQPGTYRVAGYSDSLMASYKIGDETKRWRGKPEALAKELPAEAKEVQVTRAQSRVETYITNDRADPKNGGKTFAPFGTGLELIPQTSPTDLSAGETTSFRVLFDGKPLADADVTVIRGGNRYRYKMGEIALKTDSDGKFSVKWPEAGRYYVGATHSVKGPGGAAGTVAQPALRANVSATVEVLPQ